MKRHPNETTVSVGFDVKEGSLAKYAMDAITKDAHIDDDGYADITNKLATMALFSGTEKLDMVNPEMKNDGSVTLKKGFIDCGINPYNGLPIGSIIGNTMSIYEYARASFPAEPIRTAENIECVADHASVSVLRNNIISYFANYAQYAITQMVTLANANMIEQVKNTGKLSDYLSDFENYFNMNRREPNPVFFDASIFIKYTDGKLLMNSANDRTVHSSQMTTLGDLVNIYTYRFVDLGVILTSLISAMTINFNSFLHMLTEAHVSATDYDAFMDIYNTQQIILLSALENVVCMLYSEANDALRAWGEGRDIINITPADMHVVNSRRLYNRGYDYGDGDC